MKTLMMIRRMKEVLTWVWIAVIGTAICLNVCAQTPQDWKGLEKQLNFYMANDLGRNGYYDQKPIAELMGEMADVIGPECVFAAGDVHHFEGVRSVTQARQFVVHRHILVDGNIVDRPSYRVKPGQTIQVRAKSQTMVPFQIAAEGVHRDVLPPVPGYLDVNLASLKATLTRKPEVEEIPVQVNIQYVVEFYAR